ncbi:MULTISPECIES: hypothetical protein [unclassified Gemella]|uniref:hypothetical protein n=1 Tax=unclassified Gemella TaxID=2624949 RepID=UPI001C04B18F|nr:MULTISPECIES: hypothetical protein [unclassified Gemella]MBU0278996.1 hypothetical protein [Gemella sp. zg-1178]QWQ38740.1 hypothetical protein KMP11_07305 [Gemella sp. zg-570]
MIKILKYEFLASMFSAITLLIPVTQEASVGGKNAFNLKEPAPVTVTEISLCINY